MNSNSQPKDYLKHIDILIKKIPADCPNVNLEEVCHSSLTILENLYGKENVRITTLLENKKTKFDVNPGSDYVRSNFRSLLLGNLLAIKNAIENGLIQSIERAAIGNVVADFLVLAKNSMSQGFKDVAAVLASAAIEDALKKFAILNGLDVEDKEMSDVINALKGKGLIKGPQASVVSSYIQTRNKAFHAQWEKIEKPEIQSLIAFTEEFILKNLS